MTHGKEKLSEARLYEDEGLEQQELAEMTGINPRTLGKRLGAPEADGCWLCKEITAICKVLHIPQEQIGEYFFPRVEKGESA